MGFFSRLLEKRATNVSNDAGIASSDPRIQEMFGWFGMDSASGVTVNTESALTVPSVWSATNFIAGTLAGLPLNTYRRRGANRERITTGTIPSILHDAVNDELTSFDWRKSEFEKVLTGGRSVTWIERNRSGNVLNLWPLNPKHVRVVRENMRTRYEYRESGAPLRVYSADEIIDIPFMLNEDGTTHRGPVSYGRDAIGLAIAATQYASRFFQNGGVPPFAVTGPFQSGKTLDRASDDLHEAVKRAAKDGRQALTLPSGLEITSIGSDLDKSQLIEAQRFSVEQIARIYSLPPTFLQDLTHGTFSNTEHQDLHFVKHTVKRWVEQVEQQLNLKLFGRGRQSRFVEFNVDGLLRGDFKTRMEGYAHGVQNAILTPNEVRATENRPSLPEGDSLLIQGATVPLGSQPIGGENEA